MDHDSSATLVSDIKHNGIPSFWVNTAEMQDAYSLEVKGWTKKVHWKESTIPNAGLGVFASESICKGTAYRVLKNKENLIVLNGPGDVPPLTEATKSFMANYCAQIDGVCFLMIPGSTLNHDSERANTKMMKISSVEIHGVATKDIEVGEELLCDYIAFGVPPLWLAEFVKQNGILLPFQGYNDFL